MVDEAPEAAAATTYDKSLEEAKGLLGLTSIPRTITQVARLVRQGKIKIHVKKDGGDGTELLKDTSQRSIVKNKDNILFDEAEIRALSGAAAEKEAHDLEVDAHEMGISLDELKDRRYEEAAARAKVELKIEKERQETEDKAKKASATEAEKLSDDEKSKFERLGVELGKKQVALTDAQFALAQSPRNEDKLKAVQELDGTFSPEEGARRAAAPEKSLPVLENEIHEAIDGLDAKKRPLARKALKQAQLEATQSKLEEKLPPKPEPEEAKKGRWERWFGGKEEKAKAPPAEDELQPARSRRRSRRVPEREEPLTDAIRNEAKRLQRELFDENLELEAIQYELRLNSEEDPSARPDRFILRGELEQSIRDIARRIARFLRRNKRNQVELKGIMAEENRRLREAKEAERIYDEDEDLGEVIRVGGGRDEGEDEEDLPFIRLDEDEEDEPFDAALSGDEEHEDEGEAEKEYITDAIRDEAIRLEKELFEKTIRLDRVKRDFLESEDLDDSEDLLEEQKILEQNIRSVTDRIKQFLQQNIRHRHELRLIMLEEKSRLRADREAELRSYEEAARADEFERVVFPDDEGGLVEGEDADVVPEEENQPISEELRREAIMLERELVEQKIMLEETERDLAINTEDSVLSSLGERKVELEQSIRDLEERIDDFFDVNIGNYHELEKIMAQEGRRTRAAREGGSRRILEVGDELVEDEVPHVERPLLSEELIEEAKSLQTALFEQKILLEKAEEDIGISGELYALPSLKERRDELKESINDIERRISNFLDEHRDDLAELNRIMNEEELRLIEDKIIRDRGVEDHVWQREVDKMIEEYVPVANELADIEHDKKILSKKGIRGELVSKINLGEDELEEKNRELSERLERYADRYGIIIGDMKKYAEEEIKTRRGGYTQGIGETDDLVWRGWTDEDRIRIAPDLDWEDIGEDEDKDKEPFDVAQGGDEEPLGAAQGGEEDESPASPEADEAESEEDEKLTQDEADELLGELFGD